MCGIAGVVSFFERVDLNELKSITDAIQHRGPNDSGYDVIDCHRASVGLGHRRLSILDLSSAGHQPYRFEMLSVVFNGEIYNFKEIRVQLRALGYFFTSESDTEVLIKAYHAWGIDCVAKFNGMFVFALLDKSSGVLHLVRDRAGVKPLYLYRKEKKMIFSSELKSLHASVGFRAEIDLEAVTEYFAVGYVSNPKSIFKDVEKVKPGYIYTVSLLTGCIESKCYWDLIALYSRPERKISFLDAVDCVEELVTSSCGLRMIADVPVGVFLSGGYDSSLITSILTKKLGFNLKTYTIGFADARYDESSDAKVISRHLGTTHTEHIATAEEFRRLLLRLPYIWDEPIADTSTIPTLLVSELAAKEVTVVLSADGGDEIFGGYDKYPNIIKLQKMLCQNPVMSGLFSMLSASGLKKIYPALFSNPNLKRKISKVLSIGDDKTLANIFFNANTIFNAGDMMEYMSLPSCHPVSSFNDFALMGAGVEVLNQVLAVDYKTYQCDNILAKVDRATMSFSLEGREPLLDYRIVEFVSNLPSEYKLGPGYRKRMLKEVVHRYLPKEMMDRPKRGFAAPIYSWLKDGNEDVLRHFLSRDQLRSSGIYNVGAVVRLLDGFLSGKTIDQQKLWSILNYEMWRAEWVAA